MAQPLRFREDGTFTIVQFTDTHFKNGEPPDDETTALIERVLDAEQPDLVVFTGDLIDGRPSRDPAASVRRAVAPV
ncbi:MAG TPA: metallophosphoesterase, partial [Caldilineaceae bacterium]|nr:metallophosphoesterase [Caldilineaceae bacterium]